MVVVRVLVMVVVVVEVVLVVEGVVGVVEVRVMENCSYDGSDDSFYGGGKNGGKEGYDVYDEDGGEYLMEKIKVLRWQGYNHNNKSPQEFK